ncbi:MAG: permease [Thermoleophilia bacterium]
MARPGHNLAEVGSPPACDCGAPASADEGRARTRSGRLRLYLPALIVGLVVWYLVYRQLDPVARWFTYELLGLSADGPLGGSVHFFVYDAPKVLMLLVLIVFFVGMINTFFTPERTRAILAGRREAAGNVLGAALGVVTPFCSCSAVPLFIGFLTAGVPLGVTLSFLIAAPMVNEVALVLLFGLFGWKVAALYLVTGLSIAMIAGWIIGRLGLEHWVESWVYELRTGSAEEERLGLAERMEAGARSVRDIVGRVWPYVLVGIGVGALIHGYVPEDYLASVMGRGAWWSVPLAVILGIPLYTNAAGMIPIVQALLAKGAALGTALAFMMAVIALSFPEFVILRKVLRPKMIALLVGVVGSGILAVGYLFNALGVEKLIGGV